MICIFHNITIVLRKWYTLIYDIMVMNMYIHCIIPKTFHNITIVFAINIWRDTVVLKNILGIWYKLWKNRGFNPWNSTENLWHHFVQMKNTSESWQNVTIDELVRISESQDVFVFWEHDVQSCCQHPRYTLVGVSPDWKFSWTHGRFRDVS